MDEAAKPDVDPEHAGADELIAALRKTLSGTAPHVFDQLTQLTWQGVEAVESAASGYLLFPEKLRRVRKGGDVEEIPVMLRVPRGHELRKARVAARQMLAEDGVDPAVDPDLLRDAEHCCTLQCAVRNNTEPYEPLHASARDFERRYDLPTIAQMVAKVDALVALVDPRPDQITADEMLALVAAIAKERGIRPLAAFGSAAQRSCVIFMADLLATSLGLKSSSASSGPSTPARSSSADSSTS